MAEDGILVVRLGAMGDIIHTLPAVATIHARYPQAPITWLVESKWSGLLDGNPNVARIVPLVRGSAGDVLRSLGPLRSSSYGIAIDFQGLLKSSIAARLSRAREIVGYARAECRECLASVFYSREVRTSSSHIVDKHIELARAAGAAEPVREFALPEGRPEGELPEGDFILCNPLAGWRAKEWPLDRYAALARRVRDEFGATLVLNGPAASAPEFELVPGAHIHVSGLSGLIHATRQARAVVGIDSGPLHLAAALGKPGVAIFGPTDPARNGPYGESVVVLRSPAAVTSYKRKDDYDPGMLAIDADAVVDALRERLAQPHVRQAAVN